MFVDLAFFRASISAYKLLTHLGTYVHSEKNCFSVRGFCLQQKISTRPAWAPEENRTAAPFWLMKRRNFSLCGDIEKQGANAKVQLFLMDNMFSKTPRHCMCEQGWMTGHSIPKAISIPLKLMPTRYRYQSAIWTVYIWNACLFPSDARILKADSQFPRV